MSARGLAIKLLLRTEKEQGYSNLLLSGALEKSGLPEIEKRLCKRLYYGVLERQITLDAVLERYSKTPPKKLESVVLQILRLGVYQLLYCGQIPPHAAVDESVRLCRSFKKARAAGFVNGLLRNFLRQGCEVPHFDDTKTEMSVQFAVPVWLLERLLQSYGAEKTIAFLGDSLEPPPLFVRRNPLRCTNAAFETAFGEKARPVPILAEAYQLSDGDLRSIPAFREGWFHVQDLSAQMCAVALGAKAGERVLDLCAAPGGKSCTIAEEMEGQGQVFAFDAAKNRLRLVQENAARLRLSNIACRCADGAVFQEDLAECADRVLCDVPCSGFGVLRRKPEIRQKAPEEIASLPALQYAILNNAARYVAPGGTLLYATCTLLPEENEGIVARFLDEHPDFLPAPLFPGPRGKLAESSTTLFPMDFGGDGFFLAKMVKGG